MLRSYQTEAVGEAFVPPMPFLAQAGGEVQGTNITESLEDALAARFDGLGVLRSTEVSTMLRGVDVQRNQSVLIEVLNEAYALDRQQVELFYREAEIVARLEHPHLSRVRMAEPIGHTHIRLIEQVREAESLRELLARQGWLELEHMRQIMLQVTGVLGYLWRAGVIHLNLQPENILFDANGEVMVSGFAISAQADESLRNLRTAHCPPAYCSPEQLQGHAGNQNSDIYAFGVMCYEMLTDRVPYDSNDTSYLLQQHLLRPPQPPHKYRPEIPLVLSNLVMGWLARQPEQRGFYYGDAEQLRATLKHLNLKGDAHLEWAPRDIQIAAPATNPNYAAPTAERATIRQTISLPRPAAVTNASEPVVPQWRKYWLLPLVVVALGALFYASRFERTATLTEKVTPPPEPVTQPPTAPLKPAVAAAAAAKAATESTRLVSDIPYELTVRRARALLPASLQRRAYGVVNVEVVINAQGEVVKARALAGPERLRPWAVAAAQAWKFDAPTLNGQPVQVIGHLNFDYRPVKQAPQKTKAGRPRRAVPQSTENVPEEQ